MMLRGDLYNPWFAEDDKWGFEIISGDYLGVVVHIEKLDFEPDSEEQINLSYNVINKPQEIEEVEYKSEKFEYTLQLIINDILKEAIETYEQTRADDSKESSSQ